MKFILFLKVSNKKKFIIFMNLQNQNIRSPARKLFKLLGACEIISHGQKNEGANRGQNGCLNKALQLYRI